MLHPPGKVFTGLSIVKNPPSKTTFSASGSFSCCVWSAAPSCFILSLIAAFIAASRFWAAALPAVPSFGLDAPFVIVFFWNCKKVWVTSGSFRQKQLHTNVYAKPLHTNIYAAACHTLWQQQATHMLETRSLFISGISWSDIQLLKLVCVYNLFRTFHIERAAQKYSGQLFPDTGSWHFLKQWDTGTPSGREIKVTTGQIPVSQGSLSLHSIFQRKFCVLYYL